MCLPFPTPPAPVFSASALLAAMASASIRSSSAAMAASRLSWSLRDICLINSNSSFSIPFSSLSSCLEIFPETTFACSSSFLLFHRSGVLSSGCAGSAGLAFSGVAVWPERLVLSYCAWSISTASLFRSAFFLAIMRLKVAKSSMLSMIFFTF